MKVTIEDMDIRITLDDRLGHVVLSASRLSDDGLPTQPSHTSTFGWQEFRTFWQLHNTCRDVLIGISPQIK